jgi:iron(III) transport system ATP-binding protein
MPQRRRAAAPDHALIRAHGRRAYCAAVWSILAWLKVLFIRGLSRRFPLERRGQVSALENVSFEVEPGELFVLVGDSGSGKTTLLRCIAGLEVPDGGEIRIGGQVMSSDNPPTWVPPQQRRLGMVFQSYAVWPHLTVFENVALPLREGSQRIDRREVDRRVAEALEMVELQQLARRPATLLSGGQQQRVALARAIAVSSRLLLMDEPLSNLDARLREDVRTRIRDLSKQLGSTVIYVTHDQVEAMAIADRIGLLRLGELVQFGSPAELYRQPSQPSVAEFFGQVNWLDGVASGQGLVETAVGSFRVGTPATRTGDRLTLGIRPECVVPLNGELIAGENILETTLISTVFLGEQIVAQLKVGDRVLISKTRVLNIPTGGCVRVAIQPDDIMTFAR